MKLLSFKIFTWVNSVPDMCITSIFWSMRRENLTFINLIPKIFKNLLHLNIRNLGSIELKGDFSNNFICYWNMRSLISRTILPKNEKMVKNIFLKVFERKKISEYQEKHFTEVSDAGTFEIPFLVINGIFYYFINFFLRSDTDGRMSQIEMFLSVHKS